MGFSMAVDVRVSPILEFFFMEAMIEVSDWDALCEAATDFKDTYEVEECSIQYEDTAMMARIDDTPVVGEMIGKINELLSQAIQYNLVLQELWGCKKQYKQSMMYHSHYQAGLDSPGDLSFAFYAQADERNGALCFPMHMYGVNLERHFVPQRGKLIVFPSWLYHYTQHEDMEEAQDRIVISGNYRVAR